MMDPEKILVISIRGWGKIYTDESNARQVTCRKCLDKVPAEKGFGFKAARYVGLQSGYLCAQCVGLVLEGEKEWHYNSLLGLLFPAQHFTTKPREGKALAKAWWRGGKDTLNQELHKDHGGVAS